MGQILCPPRDEHPNTEINETVTRYRSVLKLVVFGDLGASICFMFLLGMFVGAGHLIDLWISYLAYALARHCNILIMCFCALIACVQLY